MTCGTVNGLLANIDLHKCSTTHHRTWSYLPFRVAMRSSHIRPSCWKASTSRRAPTSNAGPKEAPILAQASRPRVEMRLTTSTVPVRGSVDD